MVAKANMTSIRENLIFPIMCIVLDEGLKMFCTWSFVTNYSSFWR